MMQKYIISCYIAYCYCLNGESIICTFCAKICGIENPTTEGLSFSKAALASVLPANFFKCVHVALFTFTYL